MIKYSHVSLLILCDADGLKTIKDQLGVEPTEVKFDPDEEPPPTGLTHAWRLDSPKGTEGDPTARLAALADLIEPFSDKLMALDSRFPRFIDIIYHVTPQHVGGITGEFDWFQCPAPLMKRISGWDLDVSYESFWFDHPDWVRLREPWWRQMLNSFRRTKP